MFRNKLFLLVIIIHRETQYDEQIISDFSDFYYRASAIINCLRSRENRLKLIKIDSLQTSRKLKKK